MTLAFDLDGQGTPLVLLHAFPYDRRMWEPQRAELARACRVLTPDLPGFGQSPAVPGITIDQLLEGERKTDAARIKAYQQKVYYDGHWRPEFDRWVDMLASMYQGPDKESVMLSQARASDMIFTQPVVHEFPRIAVPTVLLIGERDTTAIGRDRAPPEVAKTLGNYPKLAANAAARIPGATLVTFPTLGHSPQVEEPEKFDEALLAALGTLPSP